MTHNRIKPKAADPSQTGPRAAAPVVLFDGACGFCAGSVRFILKRDRRRRFRFAALESGFAREAIDSCGVTPEPATLVLIENGRCRTRSTAALEISRRLSGLWPLLYVLILCPRPIRDLLYDSFARNRYRWFGRLDRCFAPPPEHRERFLG